MSLATTLRIYVKMVVNVVFWPWLRVDGGWVLVKTGGVVVTGLLVLG